MAICAIVSITVTAALWLKHRIKHISIKGPYLSSTLYIKLYVTLEALQVLQLPPPLKWRSITYPCFLSGSVQFFLFKLLFFASLTISSLWHGLGLDIVKNLTIQFRFFLGRIQFNINICIFLTFYGFIDCSAENMTGNKGRERGSDTQKRDPRQESNPGPLQSLSTWDTCSTTWAKRCPISI